MTLVNNLKIPGLSLFSEPPGLHQYDVHTHDGYSVIIVEVGAKDFIHNGKTVRINSGEIAVANPGTPHGCGPVDNKPWSHRTLYIGTSLMCGLAGDADQRILLKSPRIKDANLVKRLLRCHKDTESNSDLFQQQISMLEVLADLVSRHSDCDMIEDTSNDKKAMERVELWTSMLMDKKLTRPDLNDLARCAGVHPNQVIRDFKKVLSVTPSVFIKIKRLELAKKMIREGASLSDAANGAGYSDQSHFGRNFKAAFGITPADFQTVAVSENADVSW